MSPWLIVASPLCWLAHLLVAYTAAAVYCAKWAPRGAPFSSIRWVVAAATVIALAGIAFFIARGFWRLRAGSGGGKDGTAHFIVRLSFMLSALSAIATSYQAMVVLSIGDCR